MKPDNTNAGKEVVPSTKQALVRRSSDLLSRGLRDQSETNRQWFVFFQSSPDCALILESDWSIVYANQTFSECFCNGSNPESSSLLSFLDATSVRQIIELQPVLSQSP